MRAEDLDWLAFQYVAGELPETEALALEERLAIDQVAREAVARAVELTQAIALAAAQPTLTAAGPAQEKWSRPLKWMALGAAASLVAMLLVQQTRQPVDAPAIAQNIVATNDVDLAFAWAETRDDLGSDPADADHAPESAVSETPSTESVAALDSDSESLETPAWMVIAVAGLTGAEVVEQ